MTALTYIVPPILGGVIGGFTNYLALRMLFRPHTEKRMFGMRMPFTPGIVPKEKGRIATSLGSAISDNLMSAEVLEKNLLSDDMLTKIRNSIDAFFAAQKGNGEPVREFLGHYLSEEELSAALNEIKAGITGQVAGRLSRGGLGGHIADTVVSHVTNKIKTEGLGGGITGQLLSMLGNSFWGNVADMIATPAKNYLTRNIDEIMASNGQEIAGNLINKEVESIASTPVRQLLQGKEQQIAQFTDACVGVYKKLISDRLPRIVEALDIPKIIEDRINEMDMALVERVVVTVMDKELKAVVWLGVLLGMLLGCVNIFI